MSFDDALLERIADEIERAAPELRPAAPLRVIGSGFYSFAVETPGGIVVRAAKQAESAERHRVEFRLLAALAPVLPVEVPVPRWKLPASPAMPFGAMGYRRVEGDALTPEGVGAEMQSDIAGEIGRFLAALHALPVAGFAELAPGGGDPRPGFGRLRDAVLPSLREQLQSGEVETVEAWWDELLADDTMAAFEPVLRHGDLWWGNLLVAGTPPRLVGVLDWENAQIGDPAGDLGTQFHLGSEFTHAVLTAYGAVGRTVDASFRHRVQRHWELREFYGIRFAVRYHDEDEMRDAIGKLRRGPILRPDAERL